MRIDFLRGAHSIGRIALVVLVLSPVLACGPGQEPAVDVSVPESRNHLATARLISHVSDGMVARTSAISVRFVDPHERRREEGRAMAAAFSFNPEIEGSAAWVDGRTLVFTPRHPMPPGASFRCVLDVAAVLPGEKDVKPFAFEFTVAPNHLIRWQGEFDPVDENDPMAMVYSGFLEFSDPVALEDVEEHVRLSGGPAGTSLSWRVEPGDRKFWFTSTQIERGKKPMTLIMAVPATPFGIEAEVERGAELRTLDDLGVVDLVVKDQETSPGLTITFSDPLRAGTDLSGYVRVEPHVDLTVTTVDRSLVVTGAFQREVEYSLYVRHGIPSLWNTPMKGDYSQRFRFANRKPQLAFSQTGSILPSRSEGTIAFRTINVQRVTVSVHRVFESNLGQFLQDNNLNTPTTEQWRYGDLNRVGVVAATQELEIGESRNRWVQSTLDLTPLIEGHERGLYVVSLNFNQDQMLYDCDESQGYPYYEHPCGGGYAYNHGSVRRALMVSDVGLIAKHAGDRLIVAATHLQQATPLEGVELTLYSYQNQPLESRTTDRRGLAEFTKTDGFYLEGRWNGQRTALKFRDSALGTSGFEVGGATGTAAATRAFVYTDRGVYRPGDAVHLAAIVRNHEGGFPDDHPLTLKIRNPRNQVVHEGVNRSSLDGHYTFRFTTDLGDPTGIWIADIYNGDTLLASHKLRVETVVPNRLKVRLELPQDRLGPDDREMEVGLRSAYLFGAPASGLRGEVEVRFQSMEPAFEAYPDYTFSHPVRGFSVDTQNLFDGELDADGGAAFTWERPEFENPPAAVTATLTARVFERGGRPTTEATRVKIDPYPAYVGVRELSSRWTALESPLSLNAVIVDPDGTPIPGRQLQVKIYRNERNWWWEYRSFDDYRRRFKSDVSTHLEESFTVTTGTQPVTLDFTPKHRGQILVEVSDPDGGHSVGTFLWVSTWGQPQGALEVGSHLEMEVDRETYNPGDVARITATTPADGIAFLSVEKGNQVLSYRWIELSDTSTTVEVPITGEMLPNAYVHLTTIQPHAQTTNDRPIRLYGVVPIPVEEESTRLPVVITAPSVLRPQQPFEVDVQVPRGRTATVTVAVVDEGLLDLTSFDTPDPWAFFFAKERLSVVSYDIFGAVIGTLWGNIDRRFEVGGDEDSYRQKASGPVKARRFPPVSLFATPVRTDHEGRAKFTFTMPHYMGSVRIMAVATSGPSFGSADTTAPVRDPLIVLPTLPRVIGPGEVFEVPVTVFALEDGLGATRVTIETEGPLAVEGSDRTTLQFDTKGERDLSFKLAATERAGVAKVRITASAGKTRGWAEIELAVRPVNPMMYGSKELAIAPGGKAEFTIPEMGLLGTRHATVRIAPMPGISFGHRLQYLIRYPYGCMEQTMSAVFPQLFLKDLLTDQHGDPAGMARRIDANINGGIERLRRFQVPDGGFATWPGGTTPDEWATNYAGHFLIEAGRLGYHVPSDLMNAWTRYQVRMAARESGSLATRSYRLFLLAFAGKAQMGPMNLMKEERLDELDNLSKWFLAAAYRQAGADQAAERILSLATTEVRHDRELGGTLGSAVRDRSAMLYLASMLDRPQLALELYGDVSAALGGRGYLSTHEAGYGLLAIGTYLESAWHRDADVRGRFEIGGGARPVHFDRKGQSVTFDITDDIGFTMTIHSESDLPLYAAFEWQGIPIIGPTEGEERNLDLSVRWLDEDGLELDPTSLPQGTVLWCHLRVERAPRSVENVALTQIFPSGWEIEATRLRDEAMPPWAERFQLGRETYMDIRDDRAMWFFDLGYQPLDFLVKLLTVTRGEYVLAPSYVEAMYDHNFRALVPGQPVEVVEARAP